MSSPRDHANQHADAGSEHDRLRDRIIRALAENPWAMAQEDTTQLADAVMAVVQEAIDAAHPTQWAYDQACAALNKHRERAEKAEAERDASRAETVKLRADLVKVSKEAAELEGALVETTGKAHQAGAERDQLAYERRLLGAARIVLDLVADADESRWEQARKGAADVAQRIVDEIGHPVTDEPALGPSFRDQLAQLSADRDRLRDLAAEILTHFHEHGHPGRPTIRTCWVDADIVTGWRHAAAVDQPAKEDEQCQRCHGLGHVPDWANWDDKPCPDCAPEQHDQPAKEGE